MNPATVITPWGDAGTLRDRKLRPGSGGPPEEVEKNQRERLYGAMVASVSRRGFTATRVADLVELSGVSSRSFYQLFEDKNACFQATIEALLTTLTGGAAGPAADGTWEERARRGARDFAQLIVDQPAAARTCMIESTAAGPDALRPLRATATAFEGRILAMLAESPERAEIPPQMVRAYIGALTEVARTRLRRGKEAELPALMDDLSDMFLAYTSPPVPLRLNARPPTPGPETLDDAYDHAERALRAFAMVVSENGYANTTIDQVVKRASMSATTFYANFQGKEDALLAAVESAGAQTMAAIIPAFRRCSDWRQGVRAAFGALFGFLASRPALARLMLVEVYGAGPLALDRRGETLRQLEAIIAEGRRRAPETPPVAFEAIAGGVYYLAYRTIVDSGTENLPALAPICTYLALAPFLGAEEACAVANEEAVSRPALPNDPEAIRAFSVEPLRERTLRVFAAGTNTLAGVTAELDEPADLVAHHVRELERAGLIEPVESEDRGEQDEVVYQTNMRLMYSDQWSRLSLEQREEISRQIVLLMQNEVEHSLDAGIFDSRTDRSLIRAPAPVDARGWREISELLTDTLNGVLEIQGRSARRLVHSGEDAINARTILALFELPPT